MAKHSTPTTVSIQNAPTVEDLFEKLGGFGRFQVLLLFLVMIFEVPSALIFFSPMFTGVVPKSWTCDNETIPYEDICLCNGTLKSLEGSSFVSEWGLVCKYEWIADFTTLLQMLGIGFGSPIFGPIADWYGRKKGFLATIVCMIIGGIISAVAPDVYTYAAARFLIGVGFVGFCNICGAYTMEFMTPNMRPICTAVGPLGEGIMLLGLLGYIFQNSWRNLLWVSVAPFAMIFITFPLLPESPRWLLRNNKLEEAEKVFKYIAKVNGTEPIDGSNLKQVAEFEQQSTSGFAKIGYIEFLKDRSLRSTTFCLMIVTSCCILALFGITFNMKNLGGNPYINVVLLGLWDSVGYPLSFMLSIVMTRRRTLAAFMTMTAVVLVAIAVILLVIDVSELSMLILVLCMLGKFSAAGARASSRTVSGESFPTSVRNMGVGIVWLAPGFTAALTPLLAYLGSHWPSLPLFVFAVTSLVGATFTFMLTETKGEPLRS